ncbi:MAG: hypothetical protein V2A58_11610 [Planctomycetota bacterium]
MTALHLTAAVLGASLLWLVNRWAMKGDGRPEVFGFFGCVFATAFCALVAFFSQETFPLASAWPACAVVGLAFAVGYWLIVMHCIRIGPLGPTVLMNNMGFVIAVFAGLLWLKPRSVNRWLVAGLALTCVSLVLSGVSGRGGSRRGDRTEGAAGPDGGGSTITLRWWFWGFLAWAFAGMSLSGQLAASIAAPGAPASVVATYSFLAAVILLPLAARVPNIMGRSRELRGGILAAGLQTIIGVATQSALQHAGAEVVFPVTVGGPVIVVVLLGRLVYRDRPGTWGYIACAIGIAAIVFLGIGQGRIGS